MKRIGERVSASEPDGGRPLRIAVFVLDFPVVSETFVLGEITGLIDLGHEVTILAEDRGQDPVEHPDVGRYRLHERTRYLDMPRGRAARSVAAPIYYGRARAPRAAPRALNFFRYGADALSLRPFYWACRLAGLGAFDIVYCHFGPRGRMAALLREIGAIRGRLVTVFHGVDVSAYLRDDPGIYRHLFAQGDLFLAASEAFRRRLVAHGCDPQRLHVHSMGVDLRRFPFRAPVRDPGNPLRILTVGRLVEKKGIEFGLRAVAELKRRGQGARYIVVGDGPLRTPLQALGAEFGLCDSVSFPGWRDQSEVAALMRNSDVLVFPSVTDNRGDEEAVPVALKEAMATGLPVVATRHGGIPELIEDSVTGFLTDERDAMGLADALQKLARDPGLGAAMARRARSHIEASLDTRILTRDLVGHFRRLLRQTHDGPAAGQRGAASSERIHVHA